MVRRRACSSRSQPSAVIVNPGRPTGGRAPIACPRLFPFAWRTAVDWAPIPHRKFIQLYQIFTCYFAKYFLQFPFSPCASGKNRSCHAAGMFFSAPTLCMKRQIFITFSGSGA